MNNPAPRPPRLWGDSRLFSISGDYTIRVAQSEFRLGANLGTSSDPGVVAPRGARRCILDSVDSATAFACAFGTLARAILCDVAPLTHSGPIPPPDTL